MGLDSNCYNKWIKKVHDILREDVKEFKDCIQVQNNNSYWIETKIKEIYFKDNPGKYMLTLFLQK